MAGHEDVDFESMIEAIEIVELKKSPEVTIIEDPPELTAIDPPPKVAKTKNTSVLCPATTSTSAKSKANGKYRFLHRCGPCGTYYFDTKLFNAHRRQHIKPRFKCKHCEKSFISKQYHKQHELNHELGKLQVRNNVKFGFLPVHNL